MAKKTYRLLVAPDESESEFMALDPGQMNCGHAASHVYAQARAQRSEAALVAFRRAVKKVADEWRKEGHDLVLCPGCHGDVLYRILSTDGETL